MSLPEIKRGTIHEPGSSTFEEIHELIEILNEAIPRGTTSAYVYGAIGSMLVSGMRHTYRSPEKRLANFDEWVAFHRAMLTEGCN